MTPNLQIKTRPGSDDTTAADIIYKLSDFKGGMLIEKNDYSYPIWIYGVTRIDIGCNRQKTKELLRINEII